MVRQKVQKLYFQSQFSMSKINRIFSKENSFKNINSADHFLLFFFFFKFKPNLLRTDAPRILKTACTLKRTKS